MHPEAHDYVARFANPSDKITVYDVGARDINGTVRGHFPNAAHYVGVDLVDGPGVDVVADAATWKPKRKADVVVCCEVFEHTPNWADIVTNIASLIKPGGRFIATMAGPGRKPHSAVDGGAIRDDEHYRNIERDELIDAMTAAGFTQIEVDIRGVDVQATGVIDG